MGAIFPWFQHYNKKAQCEKDCDKKQTVSQYGLFTM